MTSTTRSTNYTTERHKGFVLPHATARYSAKITPAIGGCVEDICPSLLPMYSSCTGGIVRSCVRDSGTFNEPGYNCFGGFRIEGTRS